ncbi:MAG: RusA family crossover junction endodeoxyribonuclease [Planctomycetota bacterium]
MRFAPVTIRGRLIGKKNAKKVAKRGGFCRLVAKKEWTEYHALAMDALMLHKHRMLQAGHRFPIEGAVHVVWYYHPPSHVRPDYTAVCETVGDLIQATDKGGIGFIHDDKQILTMDGSRLMEIDKLEPRITIEIHPYEELDGEYKYKHPAKKKAKK